MEWWPVLIPVAIIVLIIASDIWEYYHPDEENYSDPPNGYSM